MRASVSPIAEMARLEAPNPVFFLDEVEKAGGQRESNGRVHDTLLAMIEPENACAWFDECLRTTADLRHALWVLAANETRGIPAPLLSRLSVHRIDPPPASAFDQVTEGLVAGLAADMGCDPAELPQVLRIRLIDYQLDLSALGGLPYLVLIYLVVRGGKMGERALEEQKRIQAQQYAYAQQLVAQQGGPVPAQAGPVADPHEQIAKAKALLDSGAITQAEYDQLKAKALAS